MKRIEMVLEHGFNEVTNELIEMLCSKNTKTNQQILERITASKDFQERPSACYRAFENDEAVILVTTWVITQVERKAYERLFKKRVYTAGRYFDNKGLWEEWRQAAIADEK